MSNVEVRAWPRYELLAIDHPRRKYAEHLTRTGEYTEAFLVSPHIHFTVAMRCVPFGVLAFMRPSCLVPAPRGQLEMFDVTSLPRILSTKHQILRDHEVHCGALSEVYIYS